MSAITLVEHKLLPDSMVRFGIKKLSKQRLQDEYADNPEQRKSVISNYWKTFVKARLS